METGLKRALVRNIVSCNRALMLHSSQTSRHHDTRMLEGYTEWKAMGRGGTSPTWAGYMSNLSAEKTIAFEADETLSVEIYQRPEKYSKGWSPATAAQKDNARRSFFKEPLPNREGPRARAKRFVFPQRERNAAEPQDRAVKEAYLAAFAELGDRYAQTTEWKISVLEKHGRALFIRQSLSLSPLVGPTQREICHIHETDLSGHVTLSFSDAEEVITKGWGERHRLSGTDWIHMGYTMVYVPNTVEETEVFAKIFQAGVEYMESG